MLWLHIHHSLSTTEQQPEDGEDVNEESDDESNSELSLLLTILQSSAFSPITPSLPASTSPLTPHPPTDLAPSDTAEH